MAFPSIVLQFGRQVRRRWISVALVAACGGLGAFSVAVSKTPDEPAVLLRPADGFVAVTRPIQSFTLPLQRADGAPLRYLAERDPALGIRRDRLTYGDFAGDDAYLALRLDRGGQAPSNDPHHLAATLVPDAFRVVGPPLTLTSKFGALAATDVMTAGGRDCMAFGGGEASIRFAMAGLYCAAPGSAVDRLALHCAIDRLDMVGGDAALAGYFAEAEGHRDFCGAGDPRLTSSRRPWLESGTARPPLRLASFSR